MPELPDVETLARTLRRRTAGRRIDRVRVLSPKTIRSPAPRAFARLMRGRRIERVGRRGKYLLIDLDGALTLIVHLRMTGDFAIAPAGAPLHPHTRVLFALGAEELRFVDQRRFGHMDLLPAARVHRLSGLRRLGEEPLARGFTLNRFRPLLRGRRGMLKGLLLRQDLVAGIGNLYADEILFQARLRPARPVESLRPPDVARLHGAIRAVLRRATDGLARSGRPGATLLDARGRGGACPRCGRALVPARVAGRGTYYCRACQR
ncbi:MAG TPA: bifunctional DNA-formamidopyrimidine glycosylase/DNA-(apurinic or apyrimidinic site) lyase [bacterium]|nr:bifunctional DNA-formamidopyrimidine glycosylase/DNA-(apurinic or apyrimidinic site) lyase [bacterium]